MTPLSTVIQQQKLTTRPRYRVNQTVGLPGKPGVYRIAAVYRLETWYIYALVGMDGYYAREDKLINVEKAHGTDAD